MMKPEAFAGRAGLNPATDKFTPENQDKMAIAGYMMGQAGMSQADIDAPISKQQIAKMAPVWASLPMMNGASRYGQPVKRYEDLVNVYNKNLQGLDPNSYSATTTVTATGPSGSSPSGSSPSGSSPSGGSTPPSFDPVAAAKATKTFDYMSVRKSLGVKTASISKSSRPSSSTSAYNQTQNAQQGQGQQKTEQKQTPGIPSFDAAAMSSPKKIKVLGITV